MMTQQEQFRVALARYGLRVKFSTSHLPGFTVTYPSNHKIVIMELPPSVIMGVGCLPDQKYDIELLDPDGNIIKTADGEKSSSFKTAKHVKLAILKTLKALQ
ncbi:hypothetical protein KAR91_80745 [Candidatus Pacearchaeota archaeon]|nr:hypothetical protein [Candidatus Pacearchaeota archaeon]